MLVFWRRSLIVFFLCILTVAPFAARKGVAPGVRLVVVPAKSCGGHADSAATLQMSNLLPSTLPSLCSEPSQA